MMRILIQPLAFFSLCILVSGCGSWKKQIDTQLAMSSQVSAICSIEREAVLDATDPARTLSKLVGFAPVDFKGLQPGGDNKLRFRDVEEQLRGAIEVLGTLSSTRELDKVPLPNGFSEEIRVLHGKLRENTNSNLSPQIEELTKKLKSIQVKLLKLRIAIKSALEEAKKSFSSGSCFENARCQSLWIQAIDDFYAATYTTYSETISEFEDALSSVQDVRDKSEDQLALLETITKKVSSDAAGNALKQAYAVQLATFKTEFTTRSKSVFVLITEAVLKLKALSGVARQTLPNPTNTEIQQTLEGFITAQAKTQAAKYVLRAIERMVATTEKLVDRIDDKAWFGGTLVLVANQDTIVKKVSDAVCEFQESLSADSGTKAWLQNVSGGAVILASCDALDRGMNVTDYQRASLLSVPVLQGIILGRDCTPLSEGAAETKLNDASINAKGLTKDSNTSIQKIQDLAAAQTNSVLTPALKRLKEDFSANEKQPLFSNQNNTQALRLAASQFANPLPAEITPQLPKPPPTSKPPSALDQPAALVPNLKKRFDEVMRLVP